MIFCVEFMHSIYIAEIVVGTKALLQNWLLQVKRGLRLGFTLCRTMHSAIQIHLYALFKIEVRTNTVSRSVIFRNEMFHFPLP